jgi:hypothetical protein
MDITPLAAGASADMRSPASPAAGEEPAPDACSRCQAALRRARYELRGPLGERVVRCLRCSLSYRPLVRRSLIVAPIVGTILLAINQGNVILAGHFPESLYWKAPRRSPIACHYAVATTGAILNARRSLVHARKAERM